MPISDYIESTETILAQTAARLGTYDGWQVRTFSGTSMPALYQALSAAQLPAAVVIYQGGRREQHPRRRLALQVLLVTAAGDAESGASAARALLDQAIALLDGFTYNDALWQYQADLPLDLGGPNPTYLLSIDVHLG